MSVSSNQTNVNSKDIAEKLLGNIRWEENDKGFCTCPGEHLHSNATGNRDCVIYLNDVATIFCLHQSCSEEIEQANHNLRQAIFASRPVDPERKVPKEERTRKQRAAQRLTQLELRGRTSLPKILKDYRWTYAHIQSDTKDVPSADPSNHWRHIVELFSGRRGPWIGNKYDSGGTAAPAQFQDGR